MKRIILRVALAGAVLSLAVGHSSGKTRSANGRVERELLRLTEEISLASERKDKAALDRLLADDFVLTLASGKTFDKAQMIERWAGGEPGVTEESHAVGEARVYVYGDTAIVAALITDRWLDAKGRQTYQERIFDVWRKKKGRWLLIASKPTAVVAQ